jgi:gamma-glutamylcyclotransferase (GGCT)/AIG2-like uncharacterized protein YtfP
MNEYIFSYGTLQKEKVQLELFGRILQGSVDTLNDYRVADIEINDEIFLSTGEKKNQRTLIISKYKNDRIKGMVLAITEEELLLADKYEPDNYKRIKVFLQSGKEAWMYIAIDPA